MITRTQHASVQEHRIRLSRRSLFTAVAGGLGMVAVANCSPTPVATTSPISPWNRPTTIIGYENGDLPTSVLYQYDSNCELYRPTAGSFVAMVAAAAQDGVQLQPAQGYRDYAGQIDARQYWCNLGLCGNAATPGYSNHGWGKAVDLRDQNGSLGWSSIGYQWLTEHAGEYGWNHPGGVNEAWHWEWVGDGGTMHGYAVLPNLFTWAPSQ
jgi:LAS superfamily LD-carboxypeptidase LdcB